MIKQNLISFHILERESKQPTLMTWSYPTITEEIKTYIISKCFSTAAEDNSLFFYLKKNNFWIYVQQFMNKNHPGALIVVTVELVPAKYKVLCEILVNKYTKNYNPVDLVKLYLNVITSGSVYYQENGTEILFDLITFTRGNIKDLITNFGLEIVLIYNAILLKRRILVFHHDVEKLQQEMLDMTNLIPIRNPNNYLQPLIQTVNELKGSSFYLAGTTDNNLLNNEKCYDLYVDVISHNITISKEAKNSFTMTPVHRDIAHFLVQSSENDLNEARIIEELKVKTMDILEQLKAIATCKVDNKMMVSVTDLKAKKYSPPLENFLFNLAVAENIIML